MSRRLLLLRHAKSSWDHPGLDDHDRPLAPRGRRAIDAIREHLIDVGPVPDLVLCSTARRAVDTWLGVAPDVEVELDSGLYGASDADLLRRIRQVPGRTGCILVVGHNPGLGDLAAGLAGTGDTELRRRLELKFPTGALATLTVPPAWVDLGWGGAELADYVVPRDLTNPRSS